MGNATGKLEHDELESINQRSGGGHKQYRSFSNSSAASTGSLANDTLRSRRASSLVGNLLNASGMSRLESCNGNPYRKRLTKEKERIREQHVKQLMVKYDENVDGGYLASYACYKLDKLDYNANVVRALVVERKLAPFYTPLQDFDSSWTREELIKVIDSLILHAAFEENAEEFEGVEIGDIYANDIENLVDRSLSGREQRKQRSKVFKARLYRKRILWQEAENERFLEAKQASKQKGVLDKWLPSDDLKYDLYKNGSECPICFLYFPEPMNISRCCLQPICTECFVQIKRQDPHFPHEEVDAVRDPHTYDDKDPNMLISEPASCPYCATPCFGITYDPPTNRTVGILGSPPSSYVSQSRPIDTSTSQHREGTSACLQELSLQNPPSRRHSVEHQHPSVVTSDMIRPDWEIKLIKERTKLARRSANATAIHVSNRLVDPEHHRGYSHSLTSGTSTFNSNSSVAHELEEEMIRHAMRLSLLEQQHREHS
ncbi:Sip5p Ecym_6054 [Eremothecium cymbalariae DBVPG|uniref:Protein SIP5 n=1 Tax=Eremothecium cymbalariae (strain CBS 270.75 / DBVPG 7215 / KCTC 17166 / NRRL Y-17582) TaxID=931890 RepID=G8JUX8_ERECY|nr:hypothetical protein Ecym_6054 [Eremothecium cymbalariae DBVPG\